MAEALITTDSNSPNRMSLYRTEPAVSAEHSLQAGDLATLGLLLRFRRIAIAGLDSILLESPIADGTAGVLSEDPFIEILEGRLSVDIVEDDPSPLATALVTGGPLDEPLKLARRVASVVPAVPSTPPSLILEVPFERVGE